MATRSKVRRRRSMTAELPRRMATHVSVSRSFPIYFSSVAARLVEAVDLLLKCQIGFPLRGQFRPGFSLPVGLVPISARISQLAGKRSFKGGQHLLGRASTGRFGPGSKLFEKAIGKFPYCNGCHVVACRIPAMCSHCELKRNPMRQLFGGEGQPML